MDRFLDAHGVLDRDYELAAQQNRRVAALLLPDRTPTPREQALCAVWREQRHDDAAVVGRAKLEVRALEREDVGYGRRVISKM